MFDCADRQIFLIDALKVLCLHCWSQSLANLVCHHAWVLSHLPELCAHRSATFQRLDDFQATLAPVPVWEYQALAHPRKYFQVFDRRAIRDSHLQLCPKRNHYVQSLGLYERKKFVQQP